MKNLALRSELDIDNATRDTQIHSISINISSVVVTAVSDELFTGEFSDRSPGFSRELRRSGYCNLLVVLRRANAD